MQNIWRVCGVFSGNGCLRGIKDPHVFKLTKKSGRVILSYKDWPLTGENYREVDLDSLVPDLSTPVTLKSNLEKVRSSVEEMQKDLQRWEESGRFKTEERQWWEVLQYRSPPNTGPQLDRNIGNAIERHMLRLQKTISLNITGRRNQRRNQLKDFSCHCIAEFMFMLPLYCRVYFYVYFTNYFINSFSVCLSSIKLNKFHSMGQLGVQSVNMYL